MTSDLHFDTRSGADGGEFPERCIKCGKDWVIRVRMPCPDCGCCSDDCCECDSCLGCGKGNQCRCPEVPVKYPGVPVSTDPLCDGCEHPLREHKGRDPFNGVPFCHVTKERTIISNRGEWEETVEAYCNCQEPIAPTPQQGSERR